MSSEPCPSSEAAAGQELPPVAAVIPTHNRWKKAEDSLRRLLSSDYPQLSVILVAHGCSDGTVERCREAFPTVTVEVGGEDLWWGGAINLGTRRALADGAEYVCWINDDNWVASNTIKELVEAAKLAGRRAVIASRIATPDGSEWVGQPSNLEAFAGALPYEGDPSLRLAPLPYPPGGQGVLLPASCFQEVGFVNVARFPHYWGDHEFHRRAMASGYHYYLCRAAEVMNWPNPRAEYDPFEPLEACRLLFSRTSSTSARQVWRYLHGSLPVLQPNRLFARWLAGTAYWLLTGYLSKHPKVMQVARGVSRPLVRRSSPGGSAPAPSGAVASSSSQVPPRGWPFPPALVSRIRHHARRLRRSPEARQPTTEEEQARIAALRDDLIASAPVEAESASVWRQLRTRLRERAMAEDPRAFLRWPEMGGMFWEADRCELEALMCRGDWPAWRSALKEDAIGSPKPYRWLPESSGNLVHHAYSLAQFLSASGVELRRLGSVFEFGGGYGSFCRLLIRLGFSGSYTICDLPEFSALQKYFLRSTGLRVQFEDEAQLGSTVAPRVHLVGSDGDIGTPDLFVALWSLSEVPLDLRDRLLSRLARCQRFLLAYQSAFDGIDNVSYFEAVRAARPDVRWRSAQVPHLPYGDRYLFGWTPS